MVLVLASYNTGNPAPKIEKTYCFQNDNDILQFMKNFHLMKVNEDWVLTTTTKIFMGHKLFPF